MRTFMSFFPRLFVYMLGLYAKQILRTNLKSGENLIIIISELVVCIINQTRTCQFKQWLY